MFNALYNMNDNVFVGVPTGSGKTVVLNLHFFDYSLSQIIDIAPFQEVVDQVAQWRQKFGKIQDGKNIVLLTGETSVDLCLLESGDATDAM